MVRPSSLERLLAFSPRVEVKSQVVRSIVEASKVGREQREYILRDHGIEYTTQLWVPQQGWLDAFRDIQQTSGDLFLFQAGNLIPRLGQFPPELKSLEAALCSINFAYHLDHQGGEIGSYHLADFNARARKATFVCCNPYPSEFDRGILNHFVQRFKPKDSLQALVLLDADKPTRKRGAESCTYQILW